MRAAALKWPLSGSSWKFKMRLWLYSAGAVNVWPARNNRVRDPVCSDRALKWQLFASRGKLSYGWVFTKLVLLMVGLRGTIG